MYDLTTAKNARCLLLLVLNYAFKFHYSLWNGYHDLTMLSVNISNIAIMTVKNVN